MYYDYYGKEVSYKIEQKKDRSACGDCGPTHTLTTSVPMER